jgi:hypothetical protein
MRKSRCTTSINDTSGKIAAGINVTGGKFATAINDTCGKFCHHSLVLLMPLANLPSVSTTINGNNIRLLRL